MDSPGPLAPSTTDFPTPVFVVGVARSGTSVLYRSLQQHPRFRPTRAPAGLDLTESRAFVEPWTLRDREAAPFRFLLADEEAHGRFVAAARAVPAWASRLHRAAWMRGLSNRGPRVRVAFWRLCGNDRLLRLWFREAAMARGADRLVEKTPAHVWMLPEIRATFPEARVICTHRHPLDVFTSYRRRLAAAELDPSTPATTIAWLRQSPEAFSEAYRGELEAIARGVAASPEGVLAIRYEDFTREPADALRGVLAFVGEPYVEACARAEAPSLSSWTQDPLLSRPITSNEKDWRGYVDVPTATAIEDRLADVLSRWGHSRSTRPEARVA